MILELTTLKKAFNLADYPVSITAAAGVATITLTNHNFRTGDYVTITGTTKFNGDQLVTRQNPNTLTFATAETGTESGIIKPHDEVLTNIIKRVEGEIASYCNIVFGEETSATEIYDLNVDGIIYPKRGYLVDGSVTQLLLSKSNNFTDASKYITLTSSDYFLYEDRIELKFEKCAEYLNCKRAVKITYTTQVVPDKIKAIALSMAEFYFRIYNSKAINLVGESINGEQRSFRDSLPEQIVTDLENFKRMIIGKPY